MSDHWDDCLQPGFTEPDLFADQPWPSPHPNEGMEAYEKRLVLGGFIPIPSPPKYGPIPQPPPGKVGPSESGSPIRLWLVFAWLTALGWATAFQWVCILAMTAVTLLVGFGEKYDDPDQLPE